MGPTYVGTVGPPNVGIPKLVAWMAGDWPSGQFAARQWPKHEIPGVMFVHEDAEHETLYGLDGAGNAYLSIHWLSVAVDRIPLEELRSYVARAQTATGWFTMAQGQWP